MLIKPKKKKLLCKNTGWCESALRYWMRHSNEWQKKKNAVDANAEKKKTLKSGEKKFVINNIVSAIHANFNQFHSMS
jgi:hypothetical protein